MKPDCASPPEFFMRRKKLADRRRTTQDRFRHAVKRVAQRAYANGRWRMLRERHAYRGLRSNAVSPRKFRYCAEQVQPKWPEC
jgi:hypothetical protein